MTKKYSGVSKHRTTVTTYNPRGQEQSMASEAWRGELCREDLLAETHLWC